MTTLERLAVKQKVEAFQWLVAHPGAIKYSDLLHCWIVQQEPSPHQFDSLETAIAYARSLECSTLTT
jgi:hypothetical protein